MESDKFHAQIDQLEELTPEARDAAKRILQAPDSAKDEIDSFGGLTAAALDSLHSFAYEFYQNGKYQQAASFFQVLTSLDLLSFDYWMGLGSSQMMAQQGAEAIISFAMATSLEPHNPIPHFHAAECFQALGDVKEALLTLEVAEDFCTESDRDLALKERIALFRDVWKGDGKTS